MQLQPRQGFGTSYLWTPHLTGRSAFCTIQDAPRSLRQAVRPAEPKGGPDHLGGTGGGDDQDRALPSKRSRFKATRLLVIPASPSIRPWPIAPRSNIIRERALRLHKADLLDLTVRSFATFPQRPPNRATAARGGVRWTIVQWRCGRRRVDSATLHWTVEPHDCAVVCVSWTVRLQTPEFVRCAIIASRMLCGAPQGWATS